MQIFQSTYTDSYSVWRPINESARASTEFLICITGIWRDLMKEYVFKKWLDLADVPELWSSLRKSARQFSGSHLSGNWYTLVS
jgi:hypothetical protein